MPSRGRESYQRLVPSMCARSSELCVYFIGLDMQVTRLDPTAPLDHGGPTWLASEYNRVQA